MQQVLFRVPFDPFGWFPDGIPLYAYGAMLFLTFVVCVWFTHRRATRLGYAIPREKIQDMAIALFIAGLAGARILYMWQFHVPWYKFFRIWEGGIVLQGGIVGGAIAFILFHRYVLSRFHITLWQMADIAGPGLAIGIAIGRVGCLLNGCCWGNVAPADCPAVDFPLLTCPSREMLVDRDRLQTAAGFLSRHDLANIADPRTVVGKIEPGSAADNAGLQEGDKIVKLKVGGDWQPNGEVLILSGPADQLTPVAAQLKVLGAVSEVDTERPGATILKAIIDKPENFKPALEAASRWLIRDGWLDTFGDMLGNWPRGRNSVQFVVERGGQEVTLPAFTPRSIGLHPTQLYETISMVLIVFFLLAFYPFRRHDGQVWVLFMVLYSIHRFLNEILRTEPVEGFNMTLAQNIGILTVLTAIGLEIYLRMTQPKRA